MATFTVENEDGGFDTIESNNYIFAAIDENGNKYTFGGKVKNDDDIYFEMFKLYVGLGYKICKEMFEAEE